MPTAEKLHFDDRITRRIASSYIPRHVTESNFSRNLRQCTQPSEVATNRPTSAAQRWQLFSMGRVSCCWQSQQNAPDRSFVSPVPHNPQAHGNAKSRVVDKKDFIMSATSFVRLFNFFRCKQLLFQSLGRGSRRIAGKDGPANGHSTGSRLDNNLQVVVINSANGKPRTTISFRG